MKKYIGTKHVEAEPMTMAEAYEKGLIVPDFTDESEEDKAGYHVKNEDGYESWLPAESFEKAYKVAETPLDRMAIEEDELVNRLEKLNGFINGEKFEELDAVTRAILTAQYESMAEYLHALCLRLTRMENGDGSYINMPFGSAIALLRKGFALRRSVWLEDTFIYYVPSARYAAMTPIAKKICDSDGFVRYHGYIAYSNADRTVGMWKPSDSDIFATDWEIAE